MNDNKIDNLYKNPIITNQKCDDYIYDEYNDYVTIVEYVGYDDVVNIPNYINGKPVLVLDDSAFYGNQYINKVIIPETVIRIGHQTFIGCDNLKEVVLPDNLEELGSAAFDVCPKLEKIIVKKGSKTYNLLKNSSFFEYLSYRKE